MHLRRLAVQKALGDVDQISEERRGGHIEAFLADVLPLQALELLDGFDDLGRVFIEPVLLLSVTRAHLLELGAGPTCAVEVRRAWTEETLRLRAAHVLPQVLVLVENVDALGICSGAGFVCEAELARCGTAFRIELQPQALKGSAEEDRGL